MFLRAIAVLLLICELTCVADDNAVVVRGTCDYVTRPGTALQSYSARYNFEVSLAGCDWVIRYEDTAALTNSGVLNTMAVGSYDGTNIYFVQFQNEQAIRTAWGRRYDSVKNQLPVAVAQIFPGDYPPPTLFPLQKLWFALASRCILSNSEGEIKPCSYVDLAIFYNDPRFRCSYKWIVDSNESDSQHLILKSRGYFFRRDPRNGKVFYDKLRPPFDRGFTNGIATWRNLTNVGGFVVPRTFTFTEYFPQMQPNGSVSSNLLATYSYNCCITNIQLGVMPKVPFPLPQGRVDITDRRYIGSGYAQIAYVSKVGWLSPTSSTVAMRLQNSRKSSLEAEELSVSGGEDNDRSWSRYVVWTLLGLPFCLFGVWWFGKVKQS